MFHGTLTLLTRALKVDAKLRRAHAVRFSSTCLVFLFLIVAHASSGGIGSPGLRFFLLISWLNLALITLAGSSFFATAITEEKEDGTLGLLQLAGVSTVGLLLGKSTSRLIGALLIFFAQLPFAMLAISLGGVTAGQIIAVDIALAAFMVMLANVGLLLSVVSNRSGTATGWMTLFLLALLPGVHFGERSINTLVKYKYLALDSPITVFSETLFEFLKSISIATQIDTILAIGFDSSPVSLQVLLHLLTAGLAFMTAWLAFDRFSRYSDVSTPARGFVPRRNSRMALFIERPWKRALIWKDYHFITGGHTLAIVKLIVYPGVLIAMAINEPMLRTVTGLNYSRLAGQTLLTIMMAELALSASRIFREEVKWGTLPNLLLLPRSTASIVLSKTAGCLLGLFPVIITFGGWRLLTPVHGPQYFHLTFSAAWLFGMQFLVLLHLIALCSLLVKWGGLALAIALQLVANALLIGPMSVVIGGLTASYDNNEVAATPIIYVGCLITVILQAIILLRLQQQAAA